MEEQVSKMKHSLGFQAPKNLPNVCSDRYVTTAFSNYLWDEYK